MRSSMTAPQSSPRPLFGQLAIQAGLLEDVHVNWALAVQSQRKRAGVHLYIASILVQQRYITIQQAVELMRAQRVQIMVDPSTGYRYNVHNFDARVTYKSPESSSMLQPLQNIDSLLVRGDIGLRQVHQARTRQIQAQPQSGPGNVPAQQQASSGQHASPAAAQAQQPASSSGWGASASSEKDWDGDGWGQETAEQPGSDVAHTGEGPVFAELTAEERGSEDEDYDWYGQTILDDGSLAQQLKAAQAAMEPADETPQEAQMAPRVSHAEGVAGKARPGTVALVALPHPGYEAIYTAVTEACAEVGVATVRMDDVRDPAAIWKCVERGVQFADLVVADLSGNPQPAGHVVRQAKTGQGARKPILSISTSEAAQAVANDLGFGTVTVYNPGDVDGLKAQLATRLPELLSNRQLI